MDKDYLMRSLDAMVSFDEESALAYEKNIDKLIGDVNQDLEEREDIVELIGGKRNLEMMKDNHTNHARFILSMLKNYNAAVMVETVLWVFRAYRVRGFSDLYWAAQLNSWLGSLGSHLSEKHYRNIRPIYDWMLVNIPNFVAIADEETGCS